MHGGGGGGCALGEMVSAVAEVMTRSWRERADPRERRRESHAGHIVRVDRSKQQDFVFELASSKEARAEHEAELRQAPDGWVVAVGRFWELIMQENAAAAGCKPGDPLTPLTARMLLELSEKKAPGPDGKAAPRLSKQAVLDILKDPQMLSNVCAQLVAVLKQDATKGMTSTAAAELGRLIDAGTTLAFVRVRVHHAKGFLPVTSWRAPTSRPVVHILPGDTTAVELWQKAILPHVPCIVRGACQEIVELFKQTESFAARFGQRSVPARRTYRVDSNGRRVFTEQSADPSRPVHFGEWMCDAAAGRPSAREVYPAKMALRKVLPELANHLEARSDTPLAKYGACVGQLAHDGIYMYAGAGANTTHTHLDPAENFMLCAQGRKRLQLFAPGDCTRLYPFPSPKYHSSAIPPFTDPRNAPLEFPAYARTQPVEVEVEEGDMLYLPAYWYHGVQGEEGFNVVLAWWTAIHERKRDDSVSNEFMPTRPVYTEGFLTHDEQAGAP